MNRAGAGISLKGVNKGFKDGERTVLALDHVSLEVEPASSLAVVGPSGSGKSTLLHVIGAMVAPDEGVVRVGKASLAELNAAGRARLRRRIGFVFQRFHLVASLTAAENVALPLLPGTSKSQARAAAEEMLGRVGLAGLEDAMPRRLSGGEQQRVAIARALVAGPGVVLADEPTGNLDRATAAQVLDLLFEMVAGARATLVVATHDPALARRCERVVEMEDGKLGAKRSASGPAHRQPGGEVAR